jgi:hypothetical protein
MGISTPGIHRYELDVTDLATGVYTVRLTNAKGERGMQRLVVQ